MEKLKEKFENLKRTYESDDVVLAYDYWKNTFLNGTDSEIEEVSDSEEYDSFMLQVEDDINELIEFFQNHNSKRKDKLLIDKLLNAKDSIKDNDFLYLYDKLLPEILEEAEFLGYL